MLSISFDKNSYAPGETVCVQIDLKLSKPVKARGIFATLSCLERKLVQVSRTMDKYDYDRDTELGLLKSTHLETQTEERGKEWWHKDLKVASEGTFSEGSYSAEFVLPANAPHTSHDFGHDSLIHVWKVQAKLDIPFALDSNAEKELVVEGL